MVLYLQRLVFRYYNINLFPKYVNQTLPPKDQHSKKWLKSVSVTYNALKDSSIEYTAVGHQKLMIFIIPAHRKSSITCYF